MSQAGAAYVPSGVPLPYYARPDLAFTETRYLGAAPAGLVWADHTPAGRLMVLQAGTFRVQTGPTVANRTLAVELQDSENAFLWKAFAPADVPASTVSTLSFSAFNSNSYGSATAMVLAVPPTLIMPSSTVFFTAINWQADDQVLLVDYTRTLIPTGPELGAGRVLPVAPIRLA